MNFDSRGVLPSPPSKYRSGMRGSWKKYMYHDARACRLVANDLRNAAGCGTDNAVREATRSGISAATPHATAAPQSWPDQMHPLRATCVDQCADVLNQFGQPVIPPARRPRTG